LVFLVNKTPVVCYGRPERDVLLSFVSPEDAPPPCGDLEDCSLLSDGSYPVEKLGESREKPNFS